MVETCIITETQLRAIIVTFGHRRARVLGRIYLAAVQISRGLLSGSPGAVARFSFPRGGGGANMVIPTLLRQPSNFTRPADSANCTGSSS